MTIKFQCTVCNSAISTPDSAAGKKGKCPTCNSIIQIPAAPAVASAPPTKLRPPGPESKLTPPPEKPSPLTPLPSPALSPLPPVQPLPPLPKPEPLAPFTLPAPAANTAKPALKPLQPLRPANPPQDLPTLLPSLSPNAMTPVKGNAGFDEVYSLQPMANPLQDLSNYPASGSLPPLQPSASINPYASASPAFQRQNYSGSNGPASWPIILPASIQLFGNILALIYVILNTFVTLPMLSQVPANQPEAQRVGFMVGATIALVGMPLGVLIAMIGSVCMIARRGYVMAIIGAACSTIGCACIFFPVGIWSLIVLCIDDYRRQFR